MFSRDPQSSNYAGYWNNDSYWGRHSNGMIEISDKAALEVAGWSYTFPEGTNPPSGWINFTIEVDKEVDNGPDFVNLTFAHEATHKKLFETTNLDDDDGDNVPNAWEQVVPGMKWEVPAVGQVKNDTDSFQGHFTISGDSDASRDEEFYCVLGGALSVFGQVTANGLTGQYHGIIPVKANAANNWSVHSENWDNSN